MTRCPNCGSTAQPTIVDTEWVEDGWTVRKLTTYQCGCKHLFMTSTTYQSDGYEEVLDFIV